MRRDRVAGEQRPTSPGSWGRVASSREDGSRGPAHCAVGGECRVHAQAEGERAACRLEEEEEEELGHLCQ